MDFLSVSFEIQQRLDALRGMKEKIEMEEQILLKGLETARAEHTRLDPLNHARAVLQNPIARLQWSFAEKPICGLDDLAAKLDKIKQA